MMRPEVEELINFGCDDPDNCQDLICQDERKRLRALIELGVRLGLAAAHQAVHDTDIAGRDTLLHALRDISAITVASVLEVGECCYKCKQPVATQWVRDGKLEHLVGNCEKCGVLSVFAGRSDDDR